MNDQTKKLGKKFYKNWRFGALAIGVFLIVIISSGGQHQKTDGQPASNQSNANIGTEQENQKNVAEKTATTTPEIQPATGAEATPTIDKKQPQVESTAPSASNPQYTYYSVSDVVDGDTLKITMDGKTETLRLIGIDTPETVDPRKPVQCFGKEASNKAKELLTGKKVRIEMDGSQGERDKYGRLLAYIYREDGLFYNKYMIAQGYAHEYTYDTLYKYQAEFKAAQKEAQDNQRGLWNPATCNGITDSTAVTAPPTQTQPAPAPQPSQQSGHIFYLSSYKTAKYYYCDTDDGWKSLTPKYLKSYSSEQELLKDYPSRTLHEACK